MGILKVLVISTGLMKRASTILKLHQVEETHCPETRTLDLQALLSPYLDVKVAEVEV